MFGDVGTAVLPLQSNGGGAVGGVAFLVLLGFLVVVLGGVWKAFEKAGQPGWGALVPIYNTYLMIRIGGNAWWWLLLLFVPLVNFFVALKVMIDVARAFGQGVGFGLGLGVLGFVFWPLLGFGGYEYLGVTDDHGARAA